MEFIFEIRREDYFEFNMFTMKNYKFYHRQKKMFRILFAIVPPATGLVNWIFQGKARVDFSEFLIFLVMFGLSAIFWIYFPKIYDKVMEANAKRILFKEGTNNIFGEKHFFFEEDGIRYITEYEEGLTKYKMITEIKTSDTAIYLYIAPATAFIIPKRVFDGEEEKEQEFMDFIYTKIKKDRDI